MKLFDNRKGYSTGFAWVFGLITLFGLGIMYIVFNQVFLGHLVPIISDQANATAIYNLDNGSTSAEIMTGVNKYMDFFHALPFILFIIVVIYMIMTAIRKERETEF